MWYIVVAGKYAMKKNPIQSNLLHIDQLVFYHDVSNLFSFWLLVSRQSLKHYELYHLVLIYEQTYEYRDRDLENKRKNKYQRKERNEERENGVGE